MEDLTLALITLTTFVMLFVVAIFADRAGAESSRRSLGQPEPVRLPGTDAPPARRDAEVA